MQKRGEGVGHRKLKPNKLRGRVLFAFSEVNCMLESC
jgi:hypothetical protein